MIVLAPGMQVGGKYTLVRQVGQGGMSEVWSAKNEMTGALVGLKILRETDDPVSSMVDRFRHEAMVGAQLDHRNIARVYDLIEEPDGTLVLVMSLLRGKSVAEHLEDRTTMPEREAVAVALGVLAALEHAHDNGILHRDIKPENVFLTVDPDGIVTPKVLDFGIAKLPTGGVHTLDGTFVGTPQYMAPERVRDGAVVDQRADLFSVGVLLYEMLTGVCPFERTSVQASLAAVIEEDIPPNPLVPPRLWYVIRSLIAKDPEARLKEAKEAMTALRGACHASDYEIVWKPAKGEKVSFDSRPPPPFTPSRPQRRAVPSATTMSGSRETGTGSSARAARGVVWATVGAAALLLGGIWLLASDGTPAEASSFRPRVGRAEIRTFAQESRRTYEEPEPEGRDAVRAQRPKARLPLIATKPDF